MGTVCSSVCEYPRERHFCHFLLFIYVFWTLLRIMTTIERTDLDSGERGFHSFSVNRVFLYNSISTGGLGDYEACCNIKDVNITGLKWALFQVFIFISYFDSFSKLYLQTTKYLKIYERIFLKVKKRGALPALLMSRKCSQLSRAIIRWTLLGTPGGPITSLANTLPPRYVGTDMGGQQGATKEMRSKERCQK